VVANFPSPTAFDAALTTLGLDRPYVRELLREDLRIRAYLDQRFAADSPDDQRRTVDDWIAGLRRRGDVVNLYEQGLSGPARDPGAPG
jgi:ABC-type amino acid transport substrate-binding protein